MDEVSCKATRMLVEAVEAEGLDPALLVRGLDVTPEALRDDARRIDWDTFVALNENLFAALGSTAALEAVGARMVRVPAFAVLQNLARTVVTPRDLYLGGMRWVAPALFPHLGFSWHEREPSRLVIACEVPAAYRGCIPFFHVCRGNIAAVATLLGEDPAPVEAWIEPNRAVMTVTLPEASSLLSRARRSSRRLLGGARLARQLEAELDESRQSLMRTRQDFRAVIASIPDGVVVHRGGTLLWLNPAVTTMLGYASPSELTGASMARFVHPDDRAAVEHRMRMPVGAVKTLQEFRFVRKDGTIVICELAPATEVEFEGASARLLVGRDITERKRLQDQLRLSERMAALGVLAAGVAHEINNPLSFAHMSVYAASEALIDPSEAARGRAREALATAREGIERVRTIVGDLRTLSRADDDAVEEVDVHAVLDSTLGLAAAEVRPRARVVRDYGNLPLAAGNRARLGQVFLNLVLNAADAMPAGESKGGEIRLRTSVDANGLIVVEVSDNGEGIPPDVLPQIFDPFFTTKSAGTGTGLGLSICHRIVTGLGGEISVQSRPRGPGTHDGARDVTTTFRVVLRAAPAAADTRKESGVIAMRPRARVLVVDDEPMLLRAVSLLVGRAHDVKTAGSGQAALDILAADDRFDVILCDLMMPNMTGVDLHAEIRKRHPGLEERMVFVSGASEAVRALAARVPNAYLDKPFDADRLLAVIDAHARARPKEPAVSTDGAAASSR